MSSTLKLLVGLGNPGSDYTSTRHNAGFWFVDRLADKFSVQFSNETKFHGEMARIQAGDIDCRLLKPMTYMNESGRAVKAIVDYFNVSTNEILVAHDEIDLDAGVVRLKKDGGHGGHNGLRDIISHLGSKDFLRLRVGVSHPGKRDGVMPHVLGRPNADDQVLIEEAMERALSVMPLVFDSKLNKAMSELNSVKRES